LRRRLCVLGRLRRLGLARRIRCGLRRGGGWAGDARLASSRNHGYFDCVGLGRQRLAERHERGQRCCMGEQNSERLREPNRARRQRRVAVEHYGKTRCDIQGERTAVMRLSLTVTPSAEVDVDEGRRNGARIVRAAPAAGLFEPERWRAFPTGGRRVQR
jgi:hypothetical protein